MRGLLVFAIVLCLSLVAPAFALDQRALYDDALRASRSGDFVEALSLWNRYLDQAPQDAAALSNRGRKAARRALRTSNGSGLLHLASTSASDGLWSGGTLNTSAMTL